MCRSVPVDRGHVLRVPRPVEGESKLSCAAGVGAVTGHGREVVAIHLASWTTVLAGHGWSVALIALAVLAARALLAWAYLADAIELWSVVIAGGASDAESCESTGHE
jgi:hypothetical protein